MKMSTFFFLSFFCKISSGRDFCGDILSGVILAAEFSPRFGKPRIYFDYLLRLTRCRIYLNYHYFYILLYLKQLEPRLSVFNTHVNMFGNVSWNFKNLVRSIVIVKEISNKYRR